jgi:protocadherin Fat 4
MLSPSISSAYIMLLGLQVYVQAYDRGEPTFLESTNRAAIDVRVIRNEYDPIYFQESYETSLEATASPGAVVTTVTATDADTAEDFKTLTYELIGDDLAPDLFSIDENSGEIRVKSSLDLDTEELYRV